MGFDNISYGDLKGSRTDDDADLIAKKGAAFCALVHYADTDGNKVIDEQEDQRLVERFDADGSGGLDKYETALAVEGFHYMSDRDEGSTAKDYNQNLYNLAGRNLYDSGVVTGIYFHWVEKGNEKYADLSVPIEQTGFTLMERWLRNGSPSLNSVDSTTELNSYGVYPIRGKFCNPDESYRNKDGGTVGDDGYDHGFGAQFQLITRWYADQSESSQPAKPASTYKRSKKLDNSTLNKLESLYQQSKQ